MAVPAGTVSAHVERLWLVSVIGPQLQRSGQIVLQFLTAPQASTMRNGCGIVGSKTFPGTARLWLAPSESTSSLAVSVAVLVCGALVMRSGGVCMIVVSRECMLSRFWIGNQRKWRFYRRHALW